MKKLTINGKTVTTEITGMKELLTERGMLFPCGGKGICGRCKINCAGLTPTRLDKKFLSDAELKDGIRLACDKETIDGLNIFFAETRPEKTGTKLEYCNIAVVLGARTVEIGILNGGLLDRVVLENTADGSLKLRSLIGKACIEFFEKYGVAKADTIAVAASGKLAAMLLGHESDGRGELLDAASYMLPADTLYILPFVNDEIGGDFLCAALEKSLPRIIIDASDSFVAGLFTKDEVFCLYHKNVTYTRDELPALKASLDLLFNKAERPIISVYGGGAPRIYGLIKDYSFTDEEDGALQVVAAASTENRVRNKLLKLRDRVSLLDTVDSDEWQRLFLAANDRYN